MVKVQALALCLALGQGLPSLAAPPERVVSMNLCTDQLAMLLAGPGQLISVSLVARDPLSSAMADKAQYFPTNMGQAEDIARLQPGLVLASRYSPPATLAMLERLNIPVAVFDPESDFNGIRANITKMGQVLGRPETAAQILADFDRDLSAFQDQGVEADARPRAALYYANGYTAGDQTLAGQIITAAGLHNIARDNGMDYGGTLALEALIMAQPDLLIKGQRYGAASRAEEILDHPALTAISGGKPARLADADWVCGTPYVLSAIAKLRDARQEFTQSAAP